MKAKVNQIVQVKGGRKYQVNSVDEANSRYSCHKLDPDLEVVSETTFNVPDGIVVKVEDRPEPEPETETENEESVDETPES